MNAADATATVTETSSAAAWVSATSFGGTQSEAVVNIAAASLVWWRLLVGTAIEPLETPGYNLARAVGYGIAVAIMLWLLLWIHKRRLLVPNGASSQCVPATRGSSSPQAPRNTNTRWLQMLLALVLVPAAAGQGNDPCASPCGQKHSCGELNESFACDVLSSGMGCDCSGCCLASLSPLAPPALPPPLPPPPSPPVPMLPPMAPGGLTVGSTAELRAALASGAALVYLLPIVYPLGGSPLNVSGISVTLESLGGEATIDAEASIEDWTSQRFDAQAIKMYYAKAKPGPTGSRAIDVSGGGRLVLRRIRIINGAAEWGGGLLVQGTGSSLLMEQVSVRNCVATGPKTTYFSYEYGGGRLACFHLSARPRRLAHSTPSTP